MNTWRLRKPATPNTSTSLVINNPDWFTLPLKLRDLDLQVVIQWNVRMAGSLITLVPVILLFIALQRYYIRGLTAGATKG